MMYDQDGVWPVADKENYSKDIDPRVELVPVEI
jgi:hypothetical protein